jgi:hypothetical protein
MAISVWARSRPMSPLLEGFGKKLREAQNETLDEPIPERWVELIKRLNEEEKREAKPQDH